MKYSYLTLFELTKPIASAASDGMNVTAKIRKRVYVPRVKNILHKKRDVNCTVYICRSAYYDVTRRHRAWKSSCLRRNKCETFSPTLGNYFLTVRSRVHQIYIKSPCRHVACVCLHVCVARRGENDVLCTVVLAVEATGMCFLSHCVRKKIKAGEEKSVQEVWTRVLAPSRFLL